MFNKKGCTKIYLFASVLRCDPKSRPVMWRVQASNEKEARRQLVRNYVLVCAGIMPVGNREVRHD